MSSSKPRLLSADFITLFALVFLTYCNTTVFYTLDVSLDVYLGMHHIGHEWRGFLIGSSSLATIASYLVLSPIMTPRRSVPCACAGAMLLVACGFAYLWASEPLHFLVLRLGNGLGVSLLLASATTLFVRIIPPGLSGRAFGLYSIAALLPFSVVPAAFDPFTGDAAMMARGYVCMSLFLVPAMLIMLTRGRRMSRTADAVEQAIPEKAVTFGDMVRNMGQPPVAMILAMTTLYLMMFSSVFYLAKSFFIHRPVANVGTFFSIQMLCIMIIRLALMGVFDKARKTRLIMLAFLMAGAGCLLTATATGPWQAYAAAAVLGSGMGVGSPVLNSLMFSVSPGRFKAVNTNLMNMFVQLGNFLGPIMGGSAVLFLGETGFLTAGAVTSMAALALVIAFTALRMEPNGEAQGQAVRAGAGES